MMWSRHVRPPAWPAPDGAPHRQSRTPRCRRWLAAAIVAWGICRAVDARQPRLLGFSRWLIARDLPPYWSSLARVELSSGNARSHFNNALGNFTQTLDLGYVAVYRRSKSTEAPPLPTGDRCALRINSGRSGREYPL